MHFMCMNTFIPLFHLFVVLKEDRRVFLIPWNWNHKQLLVAMSVLGIN